MMDKLKRVTEIKVTEISEKNADSIKGGKSCSCSCQTQNEKAATVLNTYTVS